MAKRLVCFLFLLFLFISTAAHAQRLTGSIKGKVTDETNVPVPGVNVTLESPALIGGAQLSVTNEDGQYRFLALPPGSYSLKFELSGFQTVMQNDVRVVIGSTVDNDVQIKLAQLSEMLEVSGEAPLLDPTKSGHSTNYTQEYLENTPISRFTFFDFVQMAPAASPMRFDNTSFAHSILGSNTNENMYQMDGTDLTSSLTGAAWPWPNTDTIEEIEILDIGAPAEYGNYQGAVVNVVTKSGGNEFHGDLNLFFQSDALTGSNASLDGFDFHREQYRDITFQIGGPILKDKIWFFAGLQTRREHFSEPGTDPAFPKEEDDDRYFFKITADINKKNKLIFSLHNDYYSIPGEISIVQPIETSLVETGSNPTPNLMWTSLFSDKTFLEVRYAGFYGHDVGEPQNGQYVSGHYDYATGYYSGGIMSWYDGDIWKTQVSGKITHYADDFLAGDHEFRVGVQYTNAGNDYIYAYTNGVKYYDYDNEPYLAYFQLPYHIGADVQSTGIFIDDTWNVNDNLTLNLGIRYDRSTGSIPDFPQLDLAGQETGTIVNGLDDVAEWNVVSPRLGFNYRLPWKKATQLRGHYGRYYQAMLTNYIQRAGPARSTIEGYAFNPDTGEFDDLFFALNPASQVRIDPELKDPYTDQFAIGFDREISPDIAVSTSFIYKRSRDFIGTINTGGVYEKIPFEDPVTGQIIEVFNQINDPTTDNLYLITNPDFFYETYRGFLVSLTKRMTTKWMMTASLTISKTEGFHAGSGLGPAADQDSSFFPFENAQYGQDPNDYINGDGLLNGDRTYIFKLQGSYDLPWHMRVSGNYSNMSGRPYARQIIVEGLNQGAKTIFAESRDGSRRTSRINLLDLRIEKEFPLEKMRFGISADIFNVFNSDAFYDVATTLSGAELFGVGSVFVPPRRIMLGAKFGF